MVPGEGALGPAIERFDRRVDEAFDQLRGNEALDQVFRAASTAGDFSLVWHALGGVRGIATRRADQVLILAVGLGLESLIVNQGIKRLFRRSRPTETGGAGLEVRQPSTSSFPSGHASAATFAVVLLSAWERPSRIAGWAAVGVLVGHQQGVRAHPPCFRRPRRGRHRRRAWLGRATRGAAHHRTLTALSRLPRDAYPPAQ